MRHQTRRHSFWIGLLLGGTAASIAPAEDLQRFGANPATGNSQAVTVGDVPLVHTTQLFAADNPSDLAGHSPTEQTARALDRLGAVLTEAKSGWDRVVKLNLYVSRQDVVTAVAKAVADRFAKGHSQPAISWVISKLPVNEAKVALDAVASTARPALEKIEASRGSSPLWTVIPRGTRIYVAGQAEPGQSLAEMTRKTMTSLSETLKFLGRSEADIVQLKAFLQPMSDVAEVRTALHEFFGERPVPPAVFVEWLGKRSIEIEVVAWGGRDQEGPAVEYLTPPFMKSSPVYSRVARINNSSSIYISGLYASTPVAAEPGNPPKPEAGEREVREIFATLDSILRQTGSDWKHLVKATYYCSTDAASQKLNELRPSYYNPQRPPAASKAIVTATGRSALGLTLDMIAVPAP